MNLDPNGIVAPFADAAVILVPLAGLAVFLGVLWLIDKAWPHDDDDPETRPSMDPVVAKLEAARQAETIRRRLSMAAEIDRQTWAPDQPAHSTAVEYDGDCDSNRGRCNTCGWVGPWRIWREHAGWDCARHRGEIPGPFPTDHQEQP